MYLFIIGVVAALIGVVLLVRWRRRRLEATAAEAKQIEYQQTIAPAVTWMEAVETAKASSADLTQLPAPDNGWDHLFRSNDSNRARLKNALHEYYWALRTRELVNDADRRAAAVLEATDVDEYRQKLFELCWFVEVNALIVRVPSMQPLMDEQRAKLTRLIEQRLKLITKQARQDPTVFRQVLYPFMSDYASKEESRASYKQLGIELSYPDDWNDMVARHFSAPKIGNFIDMHADRDRGEVRLLAAAALRSRSLTDVMIALAYCDEYYVDRSGRRVHLYREAIGDVLLAELAKLADQLQREAAVRPVQSQ